MDSLSHHPTTLETTMTTETKSTQTERIRNLNDELRRNLSEGAAVMTAAWLPSAPRLSPVSLRRSKCMMIFATPTTRIKNTISDPSKPTATRFFSRSIITIPADRAFDRSVRPSRHQASHHDHAGGGILKPSVHKSPLNSDTRVVNSPKATPSGVPQYRHIFASQRTTLRSGHSH